jgi:hypothetical protein
MLKGKNLWIVLGLGAAAYYIYWMKMKKDKAAKAALATTPGSQSNFTGDLQVTEYQNASGRKYVSMVGGKRTFFDTDGLPNVNMGGGKKY